MGQQGFKPLGFYCPLTYKGDAQKWKKNKRKN
jgi:hypothetical protein